MSDNERLYTLTIQGPHGGIKMLLARGDLYGPMADLIERHIRPAIRQLRDLEPAKVQHA
jgi:hypothetical protein